MKKHIQLLIIFIIAALTVTCIFQFYSNKHLKNSLGLLYSTNIGNFSMHVAHIQTYLENDQDFSKEGLENCYYEANYLQTLSLPSDLYFPSYLQLLQTGLSSISSKVSAQAPEEEIEKEKNRLLQLTASLKEGLDKMNKAGEIVKGNGITYDYEEYYKLSLRKNKTMESINSDFQKYIDKHIEMLNTGD